MNKDLLGQIVQEIKDNYAKFAVITTAASIVVGVIVTVMVIKGVISARKQSA